MLPKLMIVACLIYLGTTTKIFAAIILSFYDMFINKRRYCRAVDVPSDIALINTSSTSY